MVVFLRPEARKRWCGRRIEDANDLFDEMTINQNYHVEITASSGRVVVVRRAPYWGPRGAR